MTLGLFTKRIRNHVESSSDDDESSSDDKASISVDALRSNKVVNNLTFSPIVIFSSQALTKPRLVRIELEMSINKYLTDILRETQVIRLFALPVSHSPSSVCRHSRSLLAVSIILVII